MTQRTANGPVNAADRTCNTDSMDSALPILQRFNGLQKFFVTGFPKSGTTWVHLLANRHPDILCTGEDDFNELAKRFADLMNAYNQHTAARVRPLPNANPCVFNGEHIGPLLRSSVAILADGQIGDVAPKSVGFKFNDATLNGFEFLEDLFDDFKWVMVVRDVRDVGVSAYANNLRSSAEATRQRWPTRADLLREMIPMWIEATRRAMNRAASDPERFTVVRYEDLRTNAEPCVKALFAFLGVDCSDATVKDCVAANSFEKLSGGRAAGQEDAGNFMRKGVVGDWHDKFDAADHATCDQLLTAEIKAELALMN